MNEVLYRILLARATYLGNNAGLAAQGNDTIKEKEYKDNFYGVWCVMHDICNYRILPWSNLTDLENTFINAFNEVK